MSNVRDFDLVLFGATGYTADLILSYIQDEYSSKARPSLAIAGRSRNKLTRVQQKYKGIVEEIIVADVLDAESMTMMASKCSCLINTVGPFVLYGEATVKACIESGTDYVDINGETGFIHEMQVKYDQLAREKGVIVCMAAGFDSVASDLMFYFTMNELMKMYTNLNDKRLTLETVVHMGQKRNFWKPPFSLVDGVSNGTFRTALHGWKTGEGINILKSPLGYQSVVTNKLLHPKTTWMREINHGKGLAAFPCEIFSDAFVAKTSFVHTILNSDLESIKPASFEYGQYFGTSSLILAYLLVGFLNLGPFLVKIPGVHYLLMKLMEAGDGPSEESRKNLKTNLHSLLKVHNKSVHERKKVETTVVTEMELMSDNYSFTAASVFESARLLVSLRKQGRQVSSGGILSPVAAIGGENLLPSLSKVLKLSKL